MKTLPTLTFTTLMLFSPRAMASPTPASPSDSTSPESSEQVTLVLDPSMPEFDAVRRMLEDSKRASLANIDPPPDAAGRIVIRVSGEQYDYEVHTSVTHRDVEVDEKTITCKCSDTELSENVDAELRRAAEILAHLPLEANDPVVTQEPDPAPIASAPVPAPSISPRLSIPTDHPARPEPRPQVHSYRRARIAGAATLIAGSVLLLAGAGMVGAGSRDLLHDWTLYKRDWRPLGYAIGGVGLAGIGVGGSLLIFEEIRCRRRPDSCVTSDRNAKHRTTHQVAMGTNQ